MLSVYIPWQSRAILVFLMLYLSLYICTMGDIAVIDESKLVDRSLSRIWIKPYYGSFNGLRGIAVGMVFLCHFGGTLQGYTGNLWVGVDLFFVLSGFLITGILYDSLENPHYFRNFYVRRALRIFPVFYGFFLAVAILTPILHLHIHWNMLTFVFYFGNLVVPFTNLTAHNPTIIAIVHHGHLMEVGNIGALWSLCVEEQFYLIWPAVIWWLRDRKRLMNLCVIVSLMTVTLRFYLYFHATPIEIEQMILYWPIYTRCDTLLVGAWLALFLRGHALTQIQLRRMSNCLIWIPLPSLMYILSRKHGFLRHPFVGTVGFTLIALVAAGVLLRAIDDDCTLARVLRWHPLSGLGAISYGVYFIHLIPASPLHRLADLHPDLSNIIPVLWFFMTVAIAWLSFRFYETPFLRLKTVLAPQQSETKAH